MNDYYKQPKVLQWLLALLLLTTGIVPALFIIESGHSNPVFYILFLVYLPIFQFTSTPFLTLIGVYRYYSPMLLGYMSNNHKIDLHNGTNFDYLWVMRKCKKGLEFRNTLLIYHLEGLLNIIRQIESRGIPETVNISGTSYFFNERTLNKIGFELQRPSLFYRLNLLVNFIDLTWMYSLSRGKYALPIIWDAKKATTTGSKLVESKNVIRDLYKRMKSRTITDRLI